MQESKSEVAQLMQQIAAEYTAAQAGMSGLALGTAQHKFITARMENIGRCQEQLSALVGKEQAVKIVVEAIEHADVIG
jgi:hypothetical protein